VCLSEPQGHGAECRVSGLGSLQTLTSLLMRLPKGINLGGAAEDATSKSTLSYQPNKNWLNIFAGLGSMQGWLAAKSVPRNMAHAPSRMWPQSLLSRAGRGGRQREACCQDERRPEMMPTAAILQQRDH